MTNAIHDIHGQIREIIMAAMGRAVADEVIPAVPAPAPQARFDEAMLVICHMLSDQLDALLEGLRQAGVRVALKAVLTPSNVAWSSIQLHSELAREHAEMRRRG